ncbi:hypothetical protein ACFQ0X_10845 [Streptomyces rectiviolaceus]|uniref:Uncharacterized protein n=1 Tax=Streptomyces rectiviolaceus TaxID=332591 RepID=A0ABP6NIE6_9ACTN
MNDRLPTTADMTSLWARTTRVEITGTPGEPELRYDVRDAGELRELSGLLTVDLTADAFCCMCWGDLRFLLSDARGRHVEQLTLHLGSASSDLDCGRAGQFPLVHAEGLRNWLTVRGLRQPA